MEQATTTQEPLTIIALTGYSGSGKDTVATILADDGFTRIAFADALREEVLELSRLQSKHDINDPFFHDLATGYGQIPVPQLLIHIDNEAFTDKQPQRRWIHEIIDEIGWDEAKRTIPGVRKCLQYVGEAYRRQDPNHWIHKLTNKMERLQELGHRKFIITDLRYVNELSKLKGLSSTMVVVLCRVHRNGVGPVNNHVSEIELLEHIEHFPYSTLCTNIQTLMNTGTLDEFRVVVRNWWAGLESIHASHKEKKLEYSTKLRGAVMELDFIKYEIAKKIRSLLDDYEATTGVVVRGVDLNRRVDAFGGNMLLGVDVDVRLR